MTAANAAAEPMPEPAPAPEPDATDRPGTILAVGGISIRDADGISAFHRLVLELAGVPRPRVVFLPTATGDTPTAIADFYSMFTKLDCRPTHVELFGAPTDPAGRVAEADVVWVAGGNTANLLVLWRLHGIDGALRRAFARGAVLGGPSAGANCWFEASVTDSFGPELAPLRDGLALAPGSFCPHYDSEALRRPRYGELVRTGALPPGIACDDDAAAVFQHGALREIVIARDEARAFRVTPGGDEPLPTRRLPSLRIETR